MKIYISDTSITMYSESEEKAASTSLRRRLTDLKLENIVHEGSRLALASDIWRFDTRNLLSFIHAINTFRLIDLLS